MRLLTLLMIPVILTGCEAPAEGTTPAAAPSGRCAERVQGPYVVMHVSDGDTLVVRGERRKPVTVRLIGVDAPEVDGPYRKAEPGGVEARSFAGALLSGQPVYLESDPEQGARDKHGRVLAYVYRAGDCVLINGEIIRQGYGESYRRFRFRKREEFARYEQEARKNRRGLWAGTRQRLKSEVRIDWFRSENGKRGASLITGSLKRVPAKYYGRLFDLIVILNHAAGFCLLRTWIGYA